MKHILLNTIFLTLSSICFADVVFIDLNNVPQEIATAREAAKARGENLVVLPLDYARYKDPAREKMAKEIEQLEIVEKKACASDSLSRECQTVQEQIRKKDADMKKLSAPVYGAEELKKDLASLKTDISTIMISGHDGDASFSGEYGSIRNDEFLDVFRNYKGRSQIRSVYLLGCRSAQAETVAGIWKAAFPQAAFIAGYENIGYLRDNPQGHNFIRNVMREEPNIVAAKSIAEAQAMFRKYSGVDSRHGTAACLSAQGRPTEYLSTNNSAAPLKTLLKCPESDARKLTAYRDCAIKGGSDCPLSAAESIIPSQKCRFTLEEQTNEASKLRDQIYFLAQLGQPRSHVSPERILDFEVLPGIKEKLGLRLENMNTYPKMKEKLLLIKREYEALFTYENLKDWPAESQGEVGRQKEFIDKAWLAISNLDVSKLAFSEAGTKGIGGELRAQAFLKSRASSQPSQIQARIQVLKSQLSQEKSEFGRDNLQAEIRTLEQARTQ